MNQINKIAWHKNPHLDELAALFVLRGYGEKIFPGVTKAELVVWGKKEIAQYTPEMAMMSGILMLGLGGGMFDDHDGREQRTECATTLVAKHLGVAQNPELKRFLRDVFLADSKAEGPLQALAEEVKNLNRYWVGALDLEKMYSQVEPFFIAHIERQKEYVAADGRLRKGYKNRLNGILMVAADVMDNVQFQHAARAFGVKVIVQRNSDGLTQVLGCDVADMAGLAGRIRKAEMADSHIRPSRFLTEAELTNVGTLPDIPQWCLDNDNLLNGSESFSDTPRSRIPFQKLVQIVEKHLSELKKPEAKTQAA